MNASDPRMKELLQSSIDLNQKCCEDVSSAVARNLDLGEDQASRLFICIGAPVISSMFVMGLMTDPNQLNDNLSNEEISERCLFAQLFCWGCRDPRRTKVIAIDVLIETKRIWEIAMGKDFDASWLLDDFAKHL